MGHVRLRDLRWLGPLVLTGVTVRLAFLVAAGDLEPYADESSYLYLGVLWNRFGFYSDATEFLWSPGYPWLVATALEHLGTQGVMALKLFQVLCSAVVGATTMLIAWRLFDRRAAMISGGIWCVHLPLIGFTHTLWPETLHLAFLLPGVYLLLVWCRDSGGDAVDSARILIAGLCFAGALYVKGTALFLLPALAVVLFLSGHRRQPSDRAAAALLFLLVVGVALGPWTLRNHEVYGRFVPAAETLGKNVYMGLNGQYSNLDFPGRHWRRLAAANKPVRHLLLEPKPARWSGADDLNVIDRSRQNTRSGIEFALASPAWVARSRVKRLADWLAPMSFFARHYGLRLYGGVLNRPGVRRALVTAAFALSALVLMAAVPGFLKVIEDPASRWLLITLVLYFALSGAALQAMSRYRIPIEPLLIVFAGGSLGAWRQLGTTRMSFRFATALAWAGLACLWWLNWREWLEYLRAIW